MSHQISKPEPGRPFVLIEGSGGSPLDFAEADFVALFKEYGALVFRGFDVDMEGFSALTSRYCTGSVFNESPDRLLLDEQHNVQSVNLGVAPFPLHPELSREPFRPDICFFWAVEPPEEGGQTTVCDGVEIVKNMPPEIYNAFASRRFIYRQAAAPEVCEYWLGSSNPDDQMLAVMPEECPYRFFRVKGRLVREFTRPALHKPMFTDELAFGNFLLFARYHLGAKGFPAFDGPEIVPDTLVTAVKEISDALTVPVGWRRGDIAILDNSRFMHGRTRIVDPNKRMIASYFGYLRFAEPVPEEPQNPIWRKDTFKPPHRQMAAR